LLFLTGDMNETSSSSLAGEIAALGPWFHNLHLPDGTQTVPGHFLGDFPTFKWEQIRGHLPADLSGWTALDIGCNAGFYTFELARRGASVTGIEHRLANDPTNWWAPNHACVEAMLRSAGLRVVERPGHEIYVCEPGEPREELAWIEDELRAATGRPVPRLMS
jgi:hypothetical protein